VGLGGNSNAGAITLDQLIALNDEMAALVRAGIPLEQGLEALGGDMPGQPGRLAQLLATRMSSGESLSKILAEDDRTFPPVWRAVVAAGLRSGHLAVALESLSVTARRIADLRKIVGAGLVYPFVVVSLAYVLFVLLLVSLIPLMRAAFLDLTERADPLMTVLYGLSETVVWWAIPLPLVVIVFLAIWWRRSGRAVWVSRGASRPVSWARRFGRGRGIRGTIQLGRMATFSEIMSLLIKEQVPLEDSMILAAEASGDQAISRASRELAERLRSGEQFDTHEDLPPGLPPLMGWLLMSGNRQPDLSAALRRSAEVYRNRATRRATWTAVYFPIWVTVFIGGTATFLCGFLTFLPLLRLFYQLSIPLGT
jgi:general secretion pathway protein F